MNIEKTFGKFLERLQLAYSGEIQYFIVLCLV